MGFLDLLFRRTRRCLEEGHSSTGEPQHDPPGSVAARDGSPAGIMATYHAGGDVTEVCKALEQRSRLNPLFPFNLDCSGDGATPNV
jgi:hypothetical protein